MPSAVAKMISQAKIQPLGDRAMRFGSSNSHGRRSHSSLAGRGITNCG